MLGTEVSCTAVIIMGAPESASAGICNPNFLDRLESLANL